MGDSHLRPMEPESGDAGGHCPGVDPTRKSSAFRLCLVGPKEEGLQNATRADGHEADIKRPTALFSHPS